MAEKSFKRQAFVFLLAIGIITILGLLLSTVETIVQSYLFSQLGLSLDASGRLVTADGSPTSVMTQTTFDLIVNLFNIARIIVWMTLVIVVVRFVGFLIFATALRGSAQNEIATLLRTVISIIIYIVAFFIIFQSQYPNVQLAALFTGSTIIGIVVGLALQDTLGNLFSGIAMQADQPFQIGDVISISNRGTGVVEWVSWRGVKIRTFQNKLLVISNSSLGKETIEVAPKDGLNARLVNFSTLYTSSPTKTAQLIRESVRHIDNVSSKMRPVVRIRNLGDSSIDWEIKYWLDDYSKYNDTDALIRQWVWYAFKRENIEFPFPTRTLHIEPKSEPVGTTEKVNDAVESLSRVPVFAPLSEDEIHKLARASMKRMFAPGEPIVRKGQEGRSMFVITRGNVRVQIPDAQEHKVINRLGPNDFFGEMSLLTGEPRSATVVAEDEVDVFEIRKGALKTIFEANPELMESIGAIVEERKLLLLPESVDKDKSEAGGAKGMLSSIRKFFGIKK